MMGDDALEAVDRLAEHIHGFAHARDLAGRGDDAPEVPLGEGYVGMADILRRLREIGFDGLLVPEHLGEPRTPGEDTEAVAVEYLRRELG